MKELFKFEIESHLVEELETYVIKVALHDSEYGYNYFIDEFDPEYFDRFLKGPMLNEFTQYIYTRVRPLNSNEINNWLTISISQFRTHKPELRKTYLKEMYLSQFYPSQPKETRQAHSSVESFLELVLESYSRNFHLFESTTIQAMSDFKKGYLGSFTSFLTQESPESKIKLKTNLSVPQLAYFFKVLKEENIIIDATNADIYEFLAANFSSKKKEDISTNTLKNDFEAPDYVTIEFWRVKFMELVAKARKDKEK